MVSLAPLGEDRIVSDIKVMMGLEYKGPSMVECHEVTRMSNKIDRRSDYLKMKNNPIRNGYPKCIASPRYLSRLGTQESETEYKHQASNLKPKFVEQYSKNEESRSRYKPQSAESEQPIVEPPQVIAVNLSDSGQREKELAERSRPNIIVVPMSNQDDEFNEDKEEQDQSRELEARRFEERLRAVEAASKLNQADGLDETSDYDLGLQNSLDSYDFDEDYGQLDQFSDPQSMNTNSTITQSQSRAVNSTKKFKLWDQLGKPFRARLKKMKTIGRRPKDIGSQKPNNRSKRDTEPVIIRPKDLNRAVRKGIASAATIGVKLMDSAIRRAANNFPIRLVNLIRLRENIYKTLIQENPIFNDPLLKLGALRALTNSSTPVDVVDPQTLLRTSWEPVFRILADSLRNSTSPIRLQQSNISSNSTRHQINLANQKAIKGDNNGSFVDKNKPNELDAEVNFVKRTTELTLGGKSAPKSPITQRGLMSFKRSNRRGKSLSRRKRSVSSLLLFGPWSRFYTAFLLHKVIKHQSGMLYQAVVTELVRRYIIPTVGSTLFPSANSALTQAVRQVLPGAGATSKIANSSPLVSSLTSFLQPPQPAASSPIIVSQPAPRQVESSSNGGSNDESRLVRDKETRRDELLRGDKFGENGFMNNTQGGFDDCNLIQQNEPNDSPYQKMTHSMQSQSQIEPQVTQPKIGSLMSSASEREVNTQMWPQFPSPLALNGGIFAGPALLASYPNYLRSVFRLAHSGYSNMTREAFRGRLTLPDRFQTSISLMDPSNFFGPARPKMEPARPNLHHPMAPVAPNGANLPLPFPPDLNPEHLLNGLNNIPLPPELEALYGDALRNKSTQDKTLDGFLKGASVDQLLDILGQINPTAEKQQSDSNDNLSVPFGNQHKQQLDLLKALTETGTLGGTNKRESIDGAGKGPLSANVMAEKILASTLGVGLNNLMAPSIGKIKNGLEGGEDLIKNTSDILIQSFGNILKGLEFDGKSSKKNDTKESLESSNDNIDQPIQINLRAENAIGLINKLVSIANSVKLNEGEQIIGEKDSSKYEALMDEPLKMDQGESDDQSFIGAPVYKDDVGQSEEEELADIIGQVPVNEEQVNILNGEDSFEDPSLDDPTLMERLELSSNRVEHSTKSQEDSSRPKQVNRISATRQGKGNMIRANGRQSTLKSGPNIQTKTRPATKSTSNHSNNHLSSKMINKTKGQLLSKKSSNGIRMNINKPNSNNKLPKVQVQAKGMNKSVAAQYQHPKSLGLVSDSMRSIGSSELLNKFVQTRPTMLVNGKNNASSININGNFDSNFHINSMKNKIKRKQNNSTTRKITSRYYQPAKQSIDTKLNIDGRRKVFNKTGTTTATARVDNSNNKIFSLNSQTPESLQELSSEVSGNKTVDGFSIRVTDNARGQEQNNLNNLAMALNVMNMVLLNQRLASSSNRSSFEDSKSKNTISNNTFSEPMSGSVNSNNKMSGAGREIESSSLKDSKALKLNEDEMRREKSNETTTTMKIGTTSNRIKLDSPAKENEQLPYRLYLANSSKLESLSGGSRDPRPSDASVTRAGSFESENETNERFPFPASNHRMQGNRIRLNSSVLVSSSSSSVKANEIGNGNGNVTSSRLYSFEPLKVTGQVTTRKQPEQQGETKEETVNDLAESEYANRWNDVLKHLNLTQTKPQSPSPAA